MPRRADPLPRLRALCMAMPEATERPSHGEPAWFLRDKKLFAVYSNHHHDDRVAFWCAAPDGAQRALVDMAPERFFSPPYVGHRGWLGVYVDVRQDWKMLAGLIEDAWRCVAPAALVAQFDASRR